MKIVKIFEKKRDEVIVRDSLTQYKIKLFNYLIIFVKAPTIVTTYSIFNNKLLLPCDEYVT